MKKNKGITLIALIITIIVMLILVAVSINILVDSDLIGAAEKTADKYKTEYEKEGNMGEITVGDKTYESIDDYIYGPAPKLAYSVEGRTITVYLEDSIYEYVAKKSTPEKEKAFAEAYNFSDINALISNWYDGSREDYEAGQMEYWGVSTYEETLNLNCIAEDCFADEYVEKYGDLTETVVTVTDPTGAVHRLYYVDLWDASFTYKVNANGNYKFTATGSNGRTSELTVPFELQIETFSLMVPVKNETTGSWDNELVGSCEFVKGDSWWDLLGDVEEKTIGEGITLTYERRGSSTHGYTYYVVLVIEGREYNYWVRYEDSSQAEMDDLIIPDYTYLLENAVA